MDNARPGAPPCNGPESAPSPATIELATEAPVLATTRDVKVDALNPWSMVATRYFSTAAACFASGTVPVAIWR